MKMHLSNTFTMPAIDYAGQGNAILGIRDAGKTYTAMKAAEELLDNGIPIIVYDPVGVWKNLKVGTGKHKGYPIVTAGGEESDIRMNINNAVDIVRAAMKENVSLVIDLYSPELINKSTWIRIVQETVDLLMYENKQYGMRHIFIEEAAEFIPQRLQPQHSKVYSSLERLARMGRNARLGYTLINQRAEEVNKAILEISAFSLLHKQVGKNSIASVQKWLELLQVDNPRDIIKSLPALKQGQCWAIGQTAQPKLIQISARKTFHPDPKKPVEQNERHNKTVDVTAFVEKMNSQLKVKPQPEKPKVLTTKAPVDQNGMEKLKQENELLKKQIAEKEKTIKLLTGNVSKYTSLLKSIIEKIEKETPAIIIPVTDIPTPATVRMPTTHVKDAPRPSSNGKLSKCATALLTFLATYPDRAWSRAQIGVASGYSPSSSGFSNSISELSVRGLIIPDGTKRQLNPEVDVEAWLGTVEKRDYDIHTFKSKLGKCEREIYEVLLKHPKTSFTKEDLAARTESTYSPTSSGFSNSLSTLNTLELIKRETGQIRLNPELLEI